jgi:hypothetical protein
MFVQILIKIGDGSQSHNVSRFQFALDGESCSDYKMADKVSSQNSICFH